MTKFSFLSSLLAAGTASADIVQVPINAPHEPVSAIDSFDIANAVEPIPSLGFGTWNIRISSQNTTDAVAAAIEAGYRHIDGAKVYGNQVDVGKGIKKGLEKVGLKRSDIWVTSKLWNDHHGSPEKVAEGLNITLEELGVGYLDLYLMHWPVGNGNGGKLDYDYLTTWHAMEELLSFGTVRHIGVSNFSPGQLRRVIENSQTKPYAHQFETHPYLQQSDFVESHKEEGIYVTAYSPLANTNPTYKGNVLRKTWDWISHKFSWTTSEAPPPLLKNEEFKAIADRAGCTSSQLALAWGIERGTAVIPKSTHEEYIKENFGALECDVDERDIEDIEELEKKYLTRFNNPSKSWGVKLFEGLDGVPY